MKMAAIAQLAGQHSVRALCRALGVARSAYYAVNQKGHRPRAREDVRLGVKIATLFEQSHRTYGSPRLVMALRRAGERCGRRRVARLMRGRGLHARQKRRFRPKTTDGHHLCPIAPNRLAGSPAPSGPDQVWATDITYVPTGEGWLYVLACLTFTAASWSAGQPRTPCPRPWSHAPLSGPSPTVARRLDSCTTPSAAASMPATLTANFYKLMEWLRA